MKTKLNFTKMHGCGNDYIYFDCLDAPLPVNPNRLSEILSDRHFGIGGDGVVLICPSDKADARMRMFNADGSEGKMCGNATRCIMKYLHDRRGIRKEQYTLETLSGIKTATVAENAAGECGSVTVCMGEATFNAPSIPTTLCAGNAIGKPLMVNGTRYIVTAVSVGNPHCVVFMSRGFDLDSFEIDKIGPLFEHHTAFPEGVNTEFVTVEAPNELKMRVWERGSGETLACGTGACATAAAAVATLKCTDSEPITVKLIGGELKITFENNIIYMTGGAEIVFDGSVTVDI